MITSYIGGTLLFCVLTGEPAGPGAPLGPIGPCSNKANIALFTQPHFLLSIVKEIAKLTKPKTIILFDQNPKHLTI